MELGQKFKQIRKQRKYTIQRLAQVAGSVASLSDFENNIFRTRISCGRNLHKTC